jgi:6-phosphogluconolactonase
VGLIRITFGDERCVPPDGPESNFKMAWETLLAPARVPGKSILRMHGEINPQIAAQEYEDQLDLMARQHGEPIYRHDLILLGLGMMVIQRRFFLEPPHWKRQHDGSLQTLFPS